MAEGRSLGFCSCQMGSFPKGNLDGNQCPLGSMPTAPSPRATKERLGADENVQGWHESKGLPVKPITSVL